jgi:serine/threonine-protein kinase
VKITDFGISRPRAPSSSRTLPRPDEDDPTVTLTKPDAGEPDGASPTLTRAGFLPGTPAYMAPELIAGTQFIAPPVDVFAFGVMAFEMLAGRSPFAEPPSSAVLGGRVPADAERLERAWEGAPPDLARLVDACLSFDPDGRPTAHAIADAIR